MRYGEQSIVTYVMSVSIPLFVCLSIHTRISETTRPNDQFLCMAVFQYLLLWRRCNALYISGFVDDVMHSYNEH